MKTILITGSRGFTGSYVASLFRDNGYHVIGVVRGNPTKNEVECDLTNKGSVYEMVQKTKPDGVIHLAALSFVGHADQSAFYQVNIFAALNLLEAVEKEGLVLEKLIFSSSANVYGNPTIEAISEQVSPAPVNHYAASKLAMEYMVKTWFSRYSIIITRPFNYTGVGQNEKFLIPKIVNHYKDNKKIIELGNLDVARDFSDVRDIAQAYLKLFESEVSSEIVNLSSGHVYQLQEIINMMNEIAGYSIKVVVNPGFVRKNEIKVLKGVNDKLVKLTGYAQQYDFKETLLAMYNEKNSN